MITASSESACSIIKLYSLNARRTEMMIALRTSVDLKFTGTKGTWGGGSHRPTPKAKRNAPSGAARSFRQRPEQAHGRGGNEAKNSSSEAKRLPANTK